MPWCRVIGIDVTKRTNLTWTAWGLGFSKQSLKLELQNSRLDRKKERKQNRDAVRVISIAVTKTNEPDLEAEGLADIGGVAEAEASKLEVRQEERKKESKIAMQS